MSLQAKGDFMGAFGNPTGRFEARFRGLIDRCRPLIIEDDPADARLMTEAFKRCGIPATNIEVAIHVARSLLLLAARARAIDAGEASPPSFIVLDLRLRRRPGANVLEWLTAQPTFGRVPVMVLTGLEQAAYETRARELGADSFHIKPLLFS